VTVCARFGVLGQLREKQKARRIYGVLEKQFRIVYARPTAAGITGENLCGSSSCVGQRGFRAVWERAGPARQLVVTVISRERQR